jgi:hypothetical protein
MNAYNMISRLILNLVYSPPRALRRTTPRWSHHIPSGPQRVPSFDVLEVLMLLLLLARSSRSGGPPHGRAGY